MEIETTNMSALINRFSLFLFSAFGILIWIYVIFVYFQIPTEQEIRKSCFQTKMYSVELCEKHPTYVSLSEVPRYFISLLVISEDASFWSHRGFDWEEIKNSFVTNWQKGYYARGGSTITQQLARNLFLHKRKTVHRKILEAIITVKLERLLSKRQIIEKYINVVQFGPNVFGVNQAAQYYFKKSAAQLRPEESAFLIMLLPNPEKNSKSFFKKKLTHFAELRIKSLLRKLWMNQGMTDDEYRDSLSRLGLLFGHDSLEIQN